MATSTASVTSTDASSDSDGVTSLTPNLEQKDDEAKEMNQIVGLKQEECFTAHPGCIQWHACVTYPLQQGCNVEFTQEDVEQPFKQILMPARHVTTKSLPGRPLSHFRNTNELVRAIRDAIRGDVLHIRRHVGSGSILVVDRALPNSALVGTSTSVLLDFDYPDVQGDSSLHHSPGMDKPEQVPLGNYQRSTQGTYCSTAIDLLDTANEYLTHDTCHDLESFFWVLVWIVLRHVAHNHQLGSDTCHAFFPPYCTDFEAISMKRAFLFAPRIRIMGNRPLTELLGKFKAMVSRAVVAEDPLEGTARIPLTHNTILRIFDEALALNEWPRNDAAIPFYFKETGTNTLFGKGDLTLPMPPSDNKRRQREEGSGIVSNAPKRLKSSASRQRSDTVEITAATCMLMASNPSRTRPAGAAHTSS
ncbi:hypothetical protein ONZ51_g1134 [Trametes cubensis]|uniref:Fungal-type protein kinase domain-containing protein n=1 Tax=Trametes cubensis TaxID=1111947 RepID=A0AAD7U4C7_9APHY|nr:hypothetical protein ONZ51_g1134 [Trametes cubensis]